MIWFRRFHKWIGLAIGLQIALWMASGFMMGLLDHEKVQGIEHSTAGALPRPSIAATSVLEPHRVLEGAGLSKDVISVDLVSLLDKVLYQVTVPGAVQLFDATDGRPFSVDDDVASRIARRDYSGPGSLASISRVDAPMMEIRKHSGPAWRVDFDDQTNTSIYVSADTGAILERRNDTWRLFDIFWMLHIMDYAEREDFNNALVILVGLIAALFAVTGMVLLVESFNKEDFLALLPGDFWRKTVDMTVRGPSGEVVSTVNALAGHRLYDALAHIGIVLPSNCGGGGTCGLCEVATATDAPVTAADRRLIPALRLERGGRLACQAKVAKGGSVTISREALNAKVRTTTVVSTTCLTSHIREIEIEVPEPAIEYRAGSYVHVVIPRHRTALDSLIVPDEVRGSWGPAAKGRYGEARQEIRRAYSLATPAPDNPGRLVLNVRLMQPTAEINDVPAGAGSTYMWQLQPGQALDIVAPLGEFYAKPGASDMIVIGGGAGMAPLRAIIRDQLLYQNSDRRIDFWYGARTRADLFYEQEMNRLQSAHENFSWQPVLSEPLDSDNWTGPAGFVHEAIQAGLLQQRDDLTECQFFICGPPPMLAATRHMLAALGVPDEHVQFDDFGI